MGALAIVFALDVFISTLCMYLATKLAFVKAEIKPLILIIIVVSVLSLIPYIGWIFGLIAFVYLLMRVTNADLIDCIWVVAFIKVISFVVIAFFSQLFV
ncbi:MAG: hypothetical protein HRU25_10435 [Psychrobium sp.]|nr:hypothetical protein [Psychrobium sp.]